MNKEQTLEMKLIEQYEQCLLGQMDIDKCYECEFCDDPYCCTIPAFIRKVLKLNDT